MKISKFLLGSGILFSINSWAATFYVAKTGRDSNTCAQAQNSNTAKLTISAGVNCLRSGDTLIVKSGTYRNQEITNPPGGTATNYTTIMADPTGPRPIIIPDGENVQRGFYCYRGAACSYIKIQGFQISSAYGCVKLNGTSTDGHPHHISIVNNICNNTIDTGFYATSSRTGEGFLGGDHLIQGNEFYNIGINKPGYGPGMNAIYNPGNRTIIEKNKFHNVTHGVGIWKSGNSIKGVIVRGNLFYDIGRSNTDTWQQGANGFSAVHVSVPGGGHQIYNNVIYRSGDESTFVAIRFGTTWGQTGSASEVNHVYNNTIDDLKNSGARAISVASSLVATIYIKNNIAYRSALGIVGGGIKSNNLTADPLFVNPSTGDFRLRLGSPAINAGVTLGLVPKDILGISRPQGGANDIGAYEFVSGLLPRPPSGITILSGN